MKKQLKTLLRDKLAIDISRVQKMHEPDAGAPPKKGLLYEEDCFFNEVYDAALEATGTLPDSLKRRERRYNLMQFFSQTIPLEGLMVECGCWNGLSALVMCHYARRQNANFDGAGFHIFDSFEGLSRPTAEDSLPGKTVAELMDKFNTVTGAFSARLEDVQAALSSFPEIAYHRGWLPDTLRGIPEAKYKFVHIDVDLYDPTRGVVEYFYPRLVEGGLIICDDYGSLAWPGARRAIDEYCLAYHVPLLSISTGQAVLWKR